MNIEVSYINEIVVTGYESFNIQINEIQLRNFEIYNYQGIVNIPFLKKYFETLLQVFFKKNVSLLKFNFKFFTSDTISINSYKYYKNQGAVLYAS